MIRFNFDYNPMRLYQRTVGKILFGYVIHSLDYRPGEVKGVWVGTFHVHRMPKRRYFVADSIVYGFDIYQSVSFRDVVSLIRAWWRAYV